MAGAASQLPGPHKTLSATLLSAARPSNACAMPHGFIIPVHANLRQFLESLRRAKSMRWLPPFAGLDGAGGGDRHAVNAIDRTGSDDVRRDFSHRRRGVSNGSESLHHCGKSSVANEQRSAVGFEQDRSGIYGGFHCYRTALILPSRKSVRLLRAMKITQAMAKDVRNGAFALRSSPTSTSGPAFRKPDVYCSTFCTVVNANSRLSGRRYSQRLGAAIQLVLAAIRTTSGPATAPTA